MKISKNKHTKSVESEASSVKRNIVAATETSSWKIVNSVTLPIKFAVNCVGKLLRKTGGL